MPKRKVTERESRGGAFNICALLVSTPPAPVIESLPERVLAVVPQSTTMPPMLSITVSDPEVQTPLLSPVQPLLVRVVVMIKTSFK